MNIFIEILKVCRPFNSAYKRFNKTKILNNYFDFLSSKLGLEKRYWPAHKNCTIANYKRIYVGINVSMGRSGNYLQGAGGICFGDYVEIATNVGILSANHDLYNQRLSIKKEVIIGEYSWVGMNSVILPGVVLGPRTIVAAGSVVTKSFPQGFCVIGGSPAKIIKELDRSKFIPWRDEEEFYGFIPKADFESKSKYKEYFTKIQSIRIAQDRNYEI